MYCKNACKRSQTVEEPAVSYHTRTEYNIGSRNLTEVTPLPPLFLTGHSKELSRHAYRNPLLTSGQQNFPKKDSVITLPNFTISSPCKKDSMITHTGFATSTPKK